MAVIGIVAIRGGSIVVAAEVEVAVTKVDGVANGRLVRDSRSVAEVRTLVA